MQKQTMNTAAERSTTKTTTETRRDRWRRHIVARLAKIKNCKGYIPAKWLEEIEGRPAADFITDWLANDRGFGVKNPTPAQKYHAEVDAYYETEESTRIRNNHEREEAEQAVFTMLNNDALHGLSDRSRDFVRRFYRPGDRGLNAATLRAVKCALDWEREAEANAVA